MKAITFRRLLLASCVTAFLTGFDYQKANAAQRVIQLPNGLLTIDCNIILGESIASWRYRANGGLISSYNARLRLSSGATRDFGRLIILPPANQVPTRGEENTLVSSGIETRVELTGSALQTNGFVEFTEPGSFGQPISTICSFPAR